METIQLLDRIEQVRVVVGVFKGEINIYKKTIRKRFRRTPKSGKMYNQRYLENELRQEKEELQKRKGQRK